MVDDLDSSLWLSIGLSDDQIANQDLWGFHREMLILLVLKLQSHVLSIVVCHIDGLASKFNFCGL